jgi:Domain of unknown function (DUF4336)
LIFNYFCGAGTTMKAQGTGTPQQAISPYLDWSWPFWPVVPIYPYGTRRTLRQEVIKDTIWIFDQLQGIFYVTVPIRMTVIKLARGGLLIYAPVAPTPECIRLVNEVVEQHGDVLYIILPTISAVEHKVFVGPFARYFPKAQVFVAPNQWSFPINLPLSWLGLPSERTKILTDDRSQVPFTDEFDYAILGPVELGPGPFEEVVLFHRRSQTLLVTDTILSIPQEPPAIVQLDPYPLLFHARDSASDPFIDTTGDRIKGWQRITLFTLYFRPSVLDIPQWGSVFRNALKASDKSKKGYFGLFPFLWKENWRQSFDILRRGGDLIVAPILQELILNRAPQETLAWVDGVTRWNFERIIASHFDSPIAATPEHFRQAFSFLKKDSLMNSNPLFARDITYLKEIDKKLQKSGVVPPARPKV